MPSARTCAGLLALAGAVASGCATVTTSSRQAFSVTTQPPGASCKITREATLLGVVDPTPGARCEGYELSLRCTAQACERGNVQTPSPVSWSA